MTGKQCAKITLLSVLLVVLGLSGVFAQKTLDVCPSGCAFRSIQAALNAAARGDRISIGPGTYLENLVITKSITLRGAARDTVIIQGFEAGKPVMRISGRTHVTIEDMTISEAKVGAASETLADGIRIRGDASVALTRVRISSNGNDGMVVADRAQARVQDSMITSNADDGIFVDEQARATLENSVIEANGGCGIWAVSPQIGGQGNRMRTNGADLCGNTLPVLRLPLVPQTDKRQIAFPGEYASLQEAVDALAEDGTILIAAGTYSGGLTIYKRLTLQGAGREVATLKGSGRAPVISLITGAEATVEGLTLTQGRDGLKAAGRARGKASRITTANNSDDGIEVRDGALMTIQDARVTQNAEDGLFLSGFAQAVVEHSQILSNGRDGILARGSVLADINENQILNNNGWGIALWMDACHKEAAGDEAFTGLIGGGGNELSANKSGDLCGVSSNVKK